MELSPNADLLGRGKNLSMSATWEMVEHSLTAKNCKSFIVFPSLRLSACTPLCSMYYYKSLSFQG